MVNGIEQYEFQDDCAEFLYDKTTASDTKQVVTVKAPTGAGKTVILIKYVDLFYKNTDGKTAFVWLCPGKGNLEEQSMEKMQNLAPHIDARPLATSMMFGFEERSVTFINWEIVTKKTNNVLKSREKDNLFEKIEKAHAAGIRFIVIIDEEHSNNTAKASAMIEAFKPEHIIRVSATPVKVKHQEFYEIPENEVIAAGLITEAIVVNEGVTDSTRISDDYNVLLKLADEKRKEIQFEYEQQMEQGECDTEIRPLVIVQFPAGQPETIKAVEDKLAEFGYTYDNGMVAIWMSDQKLNTENITDMNGTPAFLLMKQAIATGWDCPRAKILVKLREGGDESFQIQTIGRIRRMPERKHYMFCYTLNNCYIYTLDSTYKNDLLSQLDKAYQVRRLFVKDIVHDFSLTKEMRNLDVDSGLDEKELLKKIHKHFVDKYGITTRTVENQQILERNDYNFSHEIDSRILHGEFHSTGELSNAAPSKTMAIKTTINTHTHGIYLQHVADEIKKITTIPTARVKKILRRLFFRSKKQKNYRITSLDNQDFYAFVINNASRLKQEFREIMADSQGVQLTFGELAKTSKFTIPESDLFKYGVVKDVKLMSKNVYKDYTTEFVSSDTRKSKPERLFERYCETADSVEWIYKNGDTGQDYLSIVYKDNLNKQWLFYPDYIVKLTNGEVWIIEAKGGEQDGHTKNIDMKVEQKFAALKAYAERYKVNWGFVRDIDEDLYFCNTEYTEDMSSDNWEILSSVLK